jgi:excisionase family DNA binding protein
MTTQEGAESSVAISDGAQPGPWAGPAPRLLTVEEARTELNIGRTLIYHLIYSGALPVVRVGRALRIRRRDLDAYVEARLSC